MLARTQVYCAGRSSKTFRASAQHFAGSAHNLLVPVLAQTGVSAAQAQSRLDRAEGLEPTGMDDVVFATALYNDGGGEALYAGGGSPWPAEIRAAYIAKWDGTSWSALGGGLNAP